MDELHETAVLPFLTTKWLGRSYYYAPEIGSTNNTLKEMVAAGSSQNPPTGTILLADYQNAGRGRLNRQWEAPPGTSLLFSTLFRPNWPSEQMHWLTMLTCVAAAEAIEAVTGVVVGVKWPNDLVVEQNGRFHKLGGLLVEGSMGENGRLQYAVVGMGLNVNIPQVQLPEAPTLPTSLMILTGQSVSRLTLLLALWQRMEHAYETAESGQSPQPAWQRRLVTLGLPVQATHTHAKTTIEGTAENVDKWGQLLVRDHEGQVHTITAGDVTLRSRQ